MSAYHARKAVKLLREDGPLDLLKEARRHIYRQYLFIPHMHMRNLASRIKYDVEIEPLNIYWVSPTQINYSASGIKSRQIGTIKRGDWDKSKSEFNNTWVYEGLHERFIKGYEWEDTKYFKKAKENIEKSGSLYGHTTIDSFINHWGKYLDNLYQTIKNEGYKTTKGVDTSNRDQERHTTLTQYKRNAHEISCNIGRNGEFLFHGGRHRLSIAKLLELDEIPIQIVVRHQGWQNLREDIYNNGLAEKYNDLHDHPDLQDILDT